MTTTDQASSANAPAAGGAGAARYVRLSPGEPAPWFRQRCTSNPMFTFDTVAGRHIVLLFHLTAADPLSAAAFELVARHRALFDDERISLFSVSVDPADERDGRLTESLPGIRHFWDFDGAIARAYGALPLEGATTGRLPARRFWMVLDPQLRIRRILPLAPDGSDHAALIAYLSALPPAATHAGRPLQAPVLFLPDVFDGDLCARLIRYYETIGGRESGFMREIDGMTRLVTDPRHKRRRDVEIVDEGLMVEARNRVHDRVAPMIRRAYQFEPTRMERYLIGCYTAEDGGHFRPHRDNTTKGTAHRRFAVSINLNDGFEGGDIFFPEFSPEGLVAPPGGAVVFSCSLLHSVQPVTRGRRFAFLPFLYDEAAAALRAENLRYFDDPDQAPA